MQTYLSRSLLLQIKINSHYRLVKVNTPSKLNGFWHTLKYKAAAVTLGGFKSEEDESIFYKNGRIDSSKFDGNNFKCGSGGNDKFKTTNLQW